jgi:spore coat polysaccharide biosynthesis predicted glycosyltransferase SpsG
MKILFLCAAGKSIGGGHLRRCLNIAEALVKKKKAKEKDIKFLIMGEKDARFFKLQAKKFEAIFVNEADGKQRINMIVEKSNPTLVIVDALSYETSFLQPRDYRIIAMGNYAPGADVYINIIRNARFKPKKEFFGYQYWPIDVPKKRKKAIRIGEKLKKIMISCGYTDPYRLTERLLMLTTKSCYLTPNAIGSEIICIITDKYPNNTEARLTKINPKSKIKKNLKSLDSEIISSDLVITAGGNTAFESAGHATPTIIVPFDNLNFRLSEALEKKGFILKTATLAKDEKEFHKVFKKISLKETRLNLHKNCLHFDGFGMERLVEIIDSQLKK